jgi:hypothetical protein
LPLAGRISRRTKYAEPAGGGGLGALAIAAALLAGFVFIGGALAIYLSQPAPETTLPPVANASGTPTLPPFVQPTASPSPTPIPTPIPTFDFGSFTPLPSGSLLPSASVTPLPTAPPPTDNNPGPTRTPRPTCNANGNPPGCRPVQTDPPRTPRPSTPPPGPAAPVARFRCSQIGSTMSMQCEDRSRGQVNQWQWTAGGGNSSNMENPPPFTYENYGEKSVTLAVSGPGGNDEISRPVQLNPPATEPPPSQPTDAPSGSPAAEDNPSASPTSAASQGSVEAVAYILGLVSVLGVIRTATTKRRRR